MHYTVTSRGNRHFEVANEKHETIGSLDYTTWAPNKAQIVIKNSDIYDLGPTGLLNRAKRITKNGVPYAEIKPDWRRSLLISFEDGKTYKFKRKSLWTSNYILVNEEETEIAMIHVNFKWNNLKFHYKIDVHGEVANRETDLVLPFILLYCTKYMRTRHAAVH